MRRAWLFASAGTTLGFGAGELAMLPATQHDDTADDSCQGCISLMFMSRHPGASPTRTVYAKEAVRAPQTTSGTPHTAGGPSTQGLQAVRDPAVNRSGSKAAEMLLQAMYSILDTLLPVAQHSR